MIRLLVALALASGCENPSRDARCTDDITPPTTQEQAHLRGITLDVYAHVIILKQSDDPFVEYRTQLAIAKRIGPDVIAAAPLVMANAELTANGGHAQILVKGLAPERTVLRTDLEKYIVDGKLLDHMIEKDLPIAVGDELAKQLQLHVGDHVEIGHVTTVLTNQDAKHPARARSAHVTAVLHLGEGDLDHRLVLMSLASAQALVDRGDEVLGIELKLAHENDAPRLAKKLNALIGEPFQAIDWCKMNFKLLRC